MKVLPKPGAQGNPDPAVTVDPAASDPNKASPGGSAVVDPPADPGSQDDQDDAGWDDKTKAYIQKLRKEAADGRTKSKAHSTELATLKEQFSKLQTGMKKALGIEDDASPEEKAAALGEENASLAFKTAVLESALDHGIPKEQLGYYEFLIHQKAGELAENEELSDEHMSAILEQVKAVSGKTTTTRTSPASPANPSAANPSALTVEKFAKLTVSEKSALYVKDQATYTALMAEAKSKKLI